MAIKLRTWGDVADGDGRIIGRATFEDIELAQRELYIRIIKGNVLNDSLDGYAAVLFEKYPSVPVTSPVIQNLGNLDFIEPDSIVAVELGSGSLRVLYRPGSAHSA